jgi:hypothetical protein
MAGGRREAGRRMVRERERESRTCMQVGSEAVWLTKPWSKHLHSTSLLLLCCGSN